MNGLLAAALLAQVQVRDAPTDWRLLKTDHFDLHYPSEALLPRAREFAGWFERARAELVGQTGIEPPRVHVFLYASFHDLRQSSFLSSFRPLSSRVRRPALEAKRPAAHLECRRNSKSRALALAEPLRNRIFIHCQDRDRWNWWFIKHELAHQVQFAHLYSFRLPSWMIVLKSPIIPDWYFEGGADHLAGIFDSRKDMIVRDLQAEGLYDMKELYRNDVLNPHDALRIYDEGSYFWRFLDEKYGAGTARRVFDRFDRGLPLASQKPIQHVVGRKLAEVEREFEKHLLEEWAPIMAGRGKPTDRLTDTRAYYRRRSWGGRWSPDGKQLAWIGNGDVHPDLYVDGKSLLGWDRGVDGSRVVSPPSWSPDGRRIVVVEERTHRDLLLLVDVSGGTRAIELDQFDELYDPAWSPDGKTIAFSALKDGTSDLYSIDLESREVTRLTEDAAADLEPAWSPDGRLAFVKETEGRTVLHLLKKGPITKSWALLEHPQWSPDGKSIAVSADAGGVYDAFAVDPETGKATRLTRFRGGVFYPAYHPDGSLVVTYFEGRGMDLFRIRPTPVEADDFDEADRAPWYDQFKKPAPAGEAAEKSREWGINWLMLPVSSGSFITPAVEFAFGDLDAENLLAIEGTALGSKSWSTSATVVNTRWRPTVGVTGGAARVDDLQEISVQPFVNVPLWNTLSVGAGWIGRERTQFFDDFPDPDFLDSGPAVTFLYSNQTSTLPRDPSWGVAFGGSAAFFDEGLGGDRDLHEYFGFFETQSDFLGEDWILWGRTTFEDLDGDVFLFDELLDIEPVVRGAEDLKGIQRGMVTSEFRFPIWRDMMLKPLGWMGIGEWLILKDLRGFAFGQAGYVGTSFDHAWDDDFGAASAGVGLRLDASIMLWPILNGRVPVRLEGWWAIVGQDNDDARGAVGFGFTLGY